MEYSGQYLTYEDYKGLGGTLDLASFNLLEFEARRLIDIKTFNRLVDGENIPQEVKLCEYNLINSINAYNDTINNINKHKDKASENTDGYSVSYITQEQIVNIINSKKEEYNYTIDKYLMFVTYNGEHLLYCGL